jgi:hypothetical protein
VAAGPSGAGAEGRAPTRLKTAGLPARTALLFLGDGSGVGDGVALSGEGNWALAAPSSATAPGLAITTTRAPIRRSEGRLATAAFRDAMFWPASDVAMASYGGRRCGGFLQRRRTRRALADRLEWGKQIPAGCCCFCLLLLGQGLRAASISVGPCALCLMCVGLWHNRTSKPFAVTGMRATPRLAKADALFHNCGNRE